MLRLMRDQRVVLLVHVAAGRTACVVLPVQVRHADEPAELEQQVARERGVRADHWDCGSLPVSRMAIAVWMILSKQA